MCDDLLCAAKIIHPTLFDPNAHQQISPQREHRLPIRRFERECAFLKDIRHPNIVKYLGMSQEPETGLPVLLMELMDESLTHFLENSSESVPYHIQLIICLDIAQALSFLHLNGIIHRDLSSNNILLIGKNRAKLTDFGMAKLTETDGFMSHVSNTLCPGTDAYMPPEAVDKNAVYTEKGDIFSFGVNIIQILTKKFPDPGNRFKTVYVDHPQFPSGKIEVRASEVERRNNHISMINPAHPLLAIALDCLKDQEGERPQAGELCRRLITLRNTPEYTESERESQERRLPILGHQISELQEHLHIKFQSSHQAVVERREFADATSALCAKEQEIHRLEATPHDVLDAREQTSREIAKTQSLQPEHLPVRYVAPTPSSQYNTVERLRLSTRCGKSAPRTMARYTNAVVNGSVAYFNPGGSEAVLAFDSITDTWSGLPDCLAEMTTLVVVKNLLTTVGGKQTNCLYSLVEEGNEHSWTEVFPSMPTRRHNVSAVCTDIVLIVAGGEEYGFFRDKTLKTVEIMNTETRQWCRAADLPKPTYRASATVCGDHLYILGGETKGLSSSNSVMACKISLSALPSLQWSKTKLPCESSTCVTMNGQLLTVGGLSISDQKYSKAIHKYNQSNDNWETIGFLDTPRINCFAVVLPGERLMVVGGDCAMLTLKDTDTVEFAFSV